MTIEWNKVTWYSKLLALALLVVLPFLGFYYGAKYEQGIEASRDAGSGTAGNALPLYYRDTSTWQRGDRPDAGWSIAYPLDFETNQIYSVKPAADWSMASNGAPGLKQFTLTIPKSFEPQTNFSEATLTIGTSRNDLAVKNCLAPLAGEMMMSTTTLINGIKFTVSSGASAGAGNLYDTTSYHVLHAGQCFAVEYTIHSTQLGNYPPQYQLKEFDPGPIRAVLDRVVGTFKFL